MKKTAPPNPQPEPQRLLPLPKWATRRPDEPDDLAFQSGAALMHLQATLDRPDLPLALLRARCALRAAEACTRMTGRSDGIPALRDEVLLLRPGDQPGPAGQIYLSWLHAIDRPVSTKALHRALPQHDAEHIREWMQQDPAGSATPIACAAATVEAVITRAPRQETTAMILGDAVLAKSMGWPHLVPLLATALPVRAIRYTGPDLRLACYRAVVSGIQDMLPLAADLERRAIALRRIAPKLRSKASDKVVDLLLSQDAITPGALHFMTDRSARRICDRVVELGVARELTGRESYRLYGL